MHEFKYAMGEATGAWPISQRRPRLDAMTIQRSLLNRSLEGLRRAWAELNTSLRGAAAWSLAPDLPDADLAFLRDRVRACLAMSGAEYARRAEATRIGHAYAALSATGRTRFLRLLGTEFGTDESAIDTAIEAWRTSRSPAARAALRESLSSPRVRLLTLLNSLPEGIKFLVDMRGELLDAAGEDEALGEVERDLKLLLHGWFDVGFLQLRRIDWHTPAAFLEKLIEYEAVHEITSWQDLKHRLASDRRLYAFVHPNMPDEPLIFVQVALCRDLAGNVQALLDTGAQAVPPEDADTAIFYSISNAQRGLAGISFGNHLIRRVVNDLKQELPGLRQFATLSPIPGFTHWLRTLLADRPDPGGEAGLHEAERQLLQGTAHADWHRDAPLAAALQPLLLRLCARYLNEVDPRKRRARDPVAHFHLGNGASIARLNWMADISAKGLSQSFGMMVNYLYDPREIDANSENYSRSAQIACAPALRDNPGRRRWPWQARQDDATAP